VNRYKNEYAFNLNVLSGQQANTQLKPHRKYFTAFYTQLIEIILLFISPTEEEEEEDSDTWTMSKASAYVLHVLVQVIDSEMMEKILLYIQTGLPSEEIKMKNICLLLFAGCCDTLPHRNRMHDYIGKHLTKVLKFLFYDSLTIRKSASLLLTKITKYYGKSGLFDSDVLGQAVPMMINALPSPNKIAINVIQSLINLTKAVGDLDTNKSSNLMSPYFENIFKELVVLAYREGAYNKDENLTMYCFLLINELIEYSSHDKQEKLSEILIYFLTQFESTLNNSISNLVNVMAVAGSSDVVLQLQSYYCTIFRAVFKKLLKKINSDMGGKIFTLLDSSFKLRQSVYDEALLAVGALASNMGEAFSEIMPRFQEFLLFALQRHNESSLCKSAIISLGHIVRAIKGNFSNYADKYIPVLLEILTHEDVSRNNKTIAITTLGEICMTINEGFLKYLDPVMQVFFSAAGLAAQTADLDDEDTEEYLKDLRFELIEAFTCISFGLDDCGKKDLFAKYVRDIFGFYNTILGDNYSQRLVKTILNFFNN
jgi:importin subunit beta-1